MSEPPLVAADLDDGPGPTPESDGLDPGTPTLDSPFFHKDNLVDPPAGSPSDSALSNQSTAKTDKDGDKDSDPAHPWYILHPLKSRFRRDWDLTLSVLIVYNAVVVPYRIAFDADPGQVMAVVDYCIDGLFAVDIVLSFFTGYQDNALVVLDQRKIAVQYISSWLLLDVVSCMPFELLAGNEGGVGSEVGELNGLLKLLKIMRLARVLRVLRLSRILKRFIAVFQVKYGYISIAKFICIVFAIAHWIACVWVLTAQVNDYSTDNTWLSSVGEWEEYDKATWYTIALYFAIMLMATIGSSIYPNNNLERIVALLCMLIGASCYAYGITNMCSLIFNFNHNEVMFRREMDELNDFMAFRCIPKGLRYRIREYFDYMHSRTSSFDEGAILARLSPSLRQEAVLLINQHIIANNSFFKQMSKEFVGLLVLRMRTHSYVPDELIVQEGSVGVDVFFVSEGTVEVVVSALGRAKPVARLHAGDYFGEIAVFKKDTIRTASIYAVTFCTCFALHRMDVEEVLANAGVDQRRAWHRVAMARLEGLKEVKAQSKDKDAPEEGATPSEAAPSPSPLAHRASPSPSPAAPKPRPKSMVVTVVGAAGAAASSLFGSKDRAAGAAPGPTPLRPPRRNSLGLTGSPQVVPSPLGRTSSLQVRVTSEEHPQPDSGSPLSASPPSRQRRNSMGSFSPVDFAPGGGGGGGGGEEGRQHRASEGVDYVAMATRPGPPPVPPSPQPGVTPVRHVSCFATSPRSAGPGPGQQHRLSYQEAATGGQHRLSYQEADGSGRAAGAGGPMEVLEEVMQELDRLRSTVAVAMKEVALREPSGRDKSRYQRLSSLNAHVI